METTESPLDVLSRAATMVQDHSPDDAAGEGVEAEDARPRAAKELPSARWRRERRLRQGRDRALAAPVPTATPTRARATAAAAAAAAAASAQPAPAQQQTSPPPSHEGVVGSFLTQSSPPSPEVLVARTAPDSPLDMSTRSRCSPPPYSSHSAPPRPSVITCAPAATAPSPPGQSWSQQQDSGSTSRQGHRRELLSGMCDPVIDEHFRRSLGKDYLSIFRDEANDVSEVTDVNDNNASNGNSITVTGLSVDDHFAKALGDTWVKLQEKSNAETVTRSSSMTSLTRDKKSAALPQQQPQTPVRGIVSI